MCFVSISLSFVGYLNSSNHQNICLTYTPFNMILFCVYKDTLLLGFHDRELEFWFLFYNFSKMEV